MQPLRFLALLFALMLSAFGVEPGKRFVITEQGAVAGGQTLNTEAIQKSIDAAAAARGGTVVIPQGTFRSGAIFLKPGVHLHVEKGGVLKGSDDIRDYPVQDTRIEGQTNRWAVAATVAIAGDKRRCMNSPSVCVPGIAFSRNSTSRCPTKASYARVAENR